MSLLDLWVSGSDGKGKLKSILYGYFITVQAASHSE